MKSYKNIGLLIITGLLLMMAFTACSSESTIPSDRHSQPIHGETRWN